MKRLPILILTAVSTIAMANPVINEYSGYQTSPDCYGSGCLPTALLKDVIENPNSYNQRNAAAQREIELMEESNEIARERLEEVEMNSLSEE